MSLGFGCINTCKRCFGTGYISSETCNDCVDCQDVCPVCKGAKETTTDVYFPANLPTPAELEKDPKLVRGLKVIASSWSRSDNAVLVHCIDPLKWVAYYAVEFVRDKTNDDPR